MSDLSGVVFNSPFLARCFQSAILSEAVFKSDLSNPLLAGLAEFALFALLS
jgi:hypothetical protein